MPDHKTVTFDADEYQLVPMVPTEEMASVFMYSGTDYDKPWVKGSEEWYGSREEFATDYAAMLAAAPAPAAQSAGQEAVACSICYGTGFDVNGKPCAFPHGPMRAKYGNAAPVNGGEREAALEEAAQIADTFKCGTCGMDGKCAAAIRKLTGERAADAQQVGQCVPLDELRADAAYLSHRVQQGTLSPDDLAKHIRAKIDAALTSPAKVPDAVMQALDRMSTPLHDSRLSGLTAELDAANIKTIRDYVLSGASPAKVGGDEREIFESRLGRGKTYTEREFTMWVDGLRIGRAALSADGGERKDAERYRLIRHCPTTVMKGGYYLSGEALDAQCDDIAVSQASNKGGEA